MISPAAKNILHLNLAPGMVVADIGTGMMATYARALSERVAPSGIVYAIDVQKSVVHHLHATLEHTHPILHSVWGSVAVPHGTSLDDNTLDVVVMAHTLPQISNLDHAMREVFRILKPGGQYLVIDAHTRIGMTDNIGNGHTIPQEQIEKVCEHVGFTVREVFSIDVYHYGIVFIK